MTRKRRILFLGGADFQIPFISKAREYGLYIGVIDINSNAPGRQYADEFFQSSVKDINAIEKIAEIFKPDGVTVGMVDIAVPACAYVTSKLGLPGIDLETAYRATNKLEMIKAFEKNNVPHPKFQFLKKNKIGIDEINIGFPIIVKPTDMAGSRGIYLVNNEFELQTALIGSSNAGDSGDILIEEYMEGPEVSVEMVIKNSQPYVIQITDKTTSGAPHFAETGHLQPSQLPSDIKNKIENVACEAAKALGLDNSLGHAEIKITSNGPKMVEMGARAGGDSIAEQLIEFSAGVSFPEIAVKIALGEDFDIPQNTLNKSSCIRFLTTKEGKLESIDGIELAQNIENVKIVKIIAKIGKQYHDMIDSSGRLGYIISQGNSAEEAKKACDMAFDAIEIKYS